MSLRGTEHLAEQLACEVVEVKGVVYHLVEDQIDQPTRDAVSRVLGEGCIEIANNQRIEDNFLTDDSILPKPGT